MPKARGQNNELDRTTLLHEKILFNFSTLNLSTGESHFSTFQPFNPRGGVRRRRGDGGDDGDVGETEIFITPVGGATSEFFKLEAK